MPLTRRSIPTILLVAILAALVAVIVLSRFNRVDLQVVEVAVSAHTVPVRPFPVPSDSRVRDPHQAPGLFLPASPGPPRNVVLFVGDGMGLGHLSTVSALAHGPAGGLALESAPVVAFVRTWAANDLVTGSAASASAISTGLKTERRVIATLPDGFEPTTLFELAADRGLSTGLVTTSGLVDATPAAFLAHAPSRYHYLDILQQMLASRADVLIGGDFTEKDRATKQPEYLELARTIETAAPGRWTVIREPEHLETAAAPLFGFFPPRPGRVYAHGPPLVRSVSRAIELLAQNPSGFLLVVEAEETDEGAHDNDIDRVVQGLQELDDAVLEVLTFASDRDDTLVLVTADHDTATPAIVDGGFQNGQATILWASDDHAATWVPLFAFGPGADRFGGVIDNTEIGRRIAELLGLGGLPPPS